MKRQHNITFARIMLAVVGAIAVFAFLILATGCSKLPKPLELSSISGRWAYVSDTTTHFYIDSATSTTAVLRYPTRLHAPLGTYSRHIYSNRILGSRLQLTAPILPGRYILYQIGSNWHGTVYLEAEDNSMVPVAIIQIDNNTDQPGPDIVTPL